MPRTDFNTLAAELVESYADSQKVYANSLILTLFGDFIAAHGGEIWLGSLIKMVAPLGINQRLVRTSVFRLTEKGLLQSQQVGRRSFYSLTDTGFRQMSSAAERIYRYDDYRWDGNWCLVLTTLSNLAQKDRERFRNELLWLGFNRLTRGVYAHPMVKQAQVHKVAGEMNIEDAVVVMEAKATGDDPFRVSGNLIRYNFNFDMMKQAYREYIDYFGDILAAAEATRDKSPELCFLVRLLLINRFRRILLSEPEIPLELMPADCLSHRAREMTERLYKQVCGPAEDYFLELGEADSGDLPPADQEYLTRFGGIPGA